MFVDFRLGVLLLHYISVPTASTPLVPRVMTGFHAYGAPVAIINGTVARSARLGSRERVSPQAYIEQTTPGLTALL